MILIPKHITQYIDSLENELRSKDTTAAKFYLQQLLELKRQMIEVSSQLSGEEQLRIVIFYLQYILKVEENAHTYTGIPKLGKFSKKVSIDDQLIHFLNYLTLEKSDITFAAHDLACFINSIPNDLEPEEAYCDFKEFKLVTTKEDWDEIKTHPGIDVEYTQNEGNPNRLKLYFVRRNGYHSVYPQKSYEELKRLYVDNGEPYTPVYFESIKVAFDIWFQVGVKGTYYVYIEE